MPELTGLLPVFKPTGMTSRDASRALIKRHGKFKFGHVGTLDPDADGVLPVLLGNATKLQDYLLEMPKAYRFTLRLGTATSTLDASGSVTETKPWEHVTSKMILEALPSFAGEIRQIPPMFSAVKLDGRELYKHARAGQSELTDEEQSRLARTVRVYHIELSRFSGSDVEIAVKCSKGTYVRTIADDLARQLGTVGHVTFLRRELSAGFSLDQCHSLETLGAPEADLSSFLIPMNQIVIGLPVWQPSDNVAPHRLLNGQVLRISVAEFLSETEDGPTPEAILKRGFLIRDDSGKGIGIGEATLELNHLLIHLKRGF